MKPMVYSCCQDKSKQTYINLYQSLVQDAATKNIILNSKSILIDFEQSAINAINKVFPGTIIKYCHFHYAQNIWKKILKSGLKQLSKEEHIQEQIVNIIGLLLVAKKEIINVLSNIDSKFDRLPGYV